MDLRLFYSFILTIMPISELRGGLPLAIIYSLEKNIPIWLVFSNIILLNILLIFFIFYFLDKIHGGLMNFVFYRNLFKKYVLRFQNRLNKIKGHSKGEFVALLFFVAIPLPGTGAWSGCLAAWLLGLERKKSILAISLGVLIAGIFILLASLGFIGLLS
jgi:uncharacterized membrane protein